MSSSMFMIGVTLQLYDRMTSNLKAATGGLDKLREKTEKLRSASVSLMADGFLAGATLAKPIKAFADLEDASTRLKSTLMGSTGQIDKQFSKVNDLAIELGNKLPGTSADFLNMFATLIQQGLSAQDVLSGVGVSAAHLAVVTKMPYEELATFYPRVQHAAGVANKDMLAFADTIQRVYHLGVSTTEMAYAFERSGGGLKMAGLQGIEHAKKLGVIYAMLIKNTGSGERVGTGFNTLLNSVMDPKRVAKANAELKKFGMSLQFVDKQGKFLGEENMIAQFEKLRKKLNPTQSAGVFQNLFGGGEDQQLAVMLGDEGMAGYRKGQERNEAQADLEKRVAMQLGTLRQLWDAASGTFVNALARFGEAMSPELKALTQWFNDLSDKLDKFEKAHPSLLKWLGLAIAAFATLAIGLGAVGLAWAGMLRYVALVAPIVGPAVGLFRMLGPVVSGLAWVMRLLAVAIGKGLWKALLMVARFAMANPLVALAVGIAAAAIWVITHWDKVKKWFSDFWDWLKDGIRQLNSWLPDWFKKYTLPGAAINLVAKTLGPDKPSAAGAGKAHVSGQVDVVVHDDGRKPTVSVKRAQGGMKVNAYAGNTMVTQ